MNTLNVPMSTGPKGNGVAGTTHLRAGTAPVHVHSERRGSTFFAAMLARQAADVDPSRLMVAGPSGDQEIAWGEHQRAERALFERDDHYRAVVETGLGGIVTPMYLPEWQTSTIPSGVTAALCRREQLPAVGGPTVTVVRWSDGTITAGLQAEAAALHSSDPGAVVVEMPILMVTASFEVSIQAVERGSMTDDAILSQGQEVWWAALNALILHGTGSTATPHQPPGLLWRAGATNQTQPILAAGGFTLYDADSADRAGRKLRNIAMREAAGISVDRARRADIVIADPTLLARMAADDANGPVLRGPTRTLGTLGSVAGADVETAGDLPTGQAVVEDPQIGAAFTAAGARSGGNQSPVIVARRDDLLLLVTDPGPTRWHYEQTKADVGNALMVVRGYAAFAAGGWQPKAVRVIHGTGTALPAIA